MGKTKKPLSKMVKTELLGEAKKLGIDFEPGTTNAAMMRALAAIKDARNPDRPGAVELDPEPELTPEELAEIAAREALEAEAKAFSEADTAAHQEQTALNEAAKEHGWEPERSAAHAIATAVNR